jgi:putative FmdB family regulatory protein
MPIYEYTCEDCQTEFEKFVRSMATAAEVKCPACGGTHVKKGWSLFGTGKASSGLGVTAASSSAACSPAGT